MIGYRDRTWCSAYPSRCANSECDRAVTTEVKADMDAWWGPPGAPIMRTDLSHGCEQIVPYPPTEKQEVGDA